MLHIKDINFCDYEFRLGQEMSIINSSNLYHESGEHPILNKEQTNVGKLE